MPPIRWQCDRWRAPNRPWHYQITYIVALLYLFFDRTVWVFRAALILLLNWLSWPFIMWYGGSLSLSWSLLSAGRRAGFSSRCVILLYSSVSERAYLYQIRLYKFSQIFLALNYGIFQEFKRAKWPLQKPVAGFQSLVSGGCISCSECSILSASWHQRHLSQSMFLIPFWLTDWKKLLGI